MQDIRLRTGTAVLLSLVAFSGISGAVAVFCWWLVFSHPLQVVRQMRAVIPAIVLIGFFSTVLGLTGGGGLAYFLRMAVIVLIGAWLYTSYRPGGFLGLGSWLLGDRTGFDLGMVAETGMQSLDLMAADLTRIRQAQELKGIRWGIRSIVPAGSILVRGALRRADETAEIMAVRGYTRGGTCCPASGTPVTDIVAAAAAICTGLIVFTPVSEFFILYH